MFQFPISIWRCILERFIYVRLGWNAFQAFLAEINRLVLIFLRRPSFASKVSKFCRSRRRLFTSFKLHNSVKKWNPLKRKNSFSRFFEFSNFWRQIFGSDEWRQRDTVTYHLGQGIFTYLLCKWKYCCTADLFTRLDSAKQVNQLVIWI